MEGKAGLYTKFVGQTANKQSVRREKRKKSSTESVFHRSVSAA